MEGLDVEHDGDDVQLEPEPRAEVRALLQEAKGDACTKEFADMFLGEAPDGIENVVLDVSSIPGGIVGAVWDGSGREVGVIDRVVNRDSNFICFTAIDDRAGDTGPHGSEAGICLHDGFLPCRAGKPAPGSCRGY